MFSKCSTQIRHVCYSVVNRRIPRVRDGDANSIVSQCAYTVTELPTSTCVVPTLANCILIELCREVAFVYTHSCYQRLGIKYFYPKSLVAILMLHLWSPRCIY